MLQRVVLALVMLVGGCATRPIDLATDRDFANRVLERLHIGQNFFEAKAALEGLGLQCHWVAVDLVPPQQAVPNREMNCSVDLLHLRGCMRDVRLYRENDSVRGIDFRFFELPEQRKGDHACGR